VISSTTLNIYPSCLLVNGSTTYQGDGTSGIFIWGAQLEAGAFATSYIPTVASQVTRSADVAVIQGSNFSSWYNQNEGTIYGEWTYSSVLNTAGNPMTLIGISDATVNNRIRIISTQFEGAVGGVSQFVLSPTIPTTSKISGAYKVNDFSVSVNGGTILADTSGTIPTVTQMQIGDLLTSRGMSGHIRQIAYYPRRLQDSELVALTS
jgi:hypothetical protein